jgi:hypothetical protein
MKAAGQKQHIKSYEPYRNIYDALMQELIGPSIVPRNLKTKETTKQAKSEVSAGRGRRKRRHHKSIKVPY